MVYGKEAGEVFSRLKDAQVQKKQARQRPSGVSTTGVCLLTGHFVLPKTACYLLSGRPILSLTPSSAKPDSELFKE